MCLHLPSPFSEPTPPSSGYGSSTVVACDHEDWNIFSFPSTSSKGLQYLLLRGTLPAFFIRSPALDRRGWISEDYRQPRDWEFPSFTQPLFIGQRLFPRCSQLKTRRSWSPSFQITTKTRDYQHPALLEKQVTVLSTRGWSVANRVWPGKGTYRIKIEW